jgi:Right handed beta helix region
MSRTHALALLLATVAALASPQAHAVQRTHVSAAFGSDANTATNCSAAAPCRFFQAAMLVTDTNGEVVVLDSGGYGAVNITKSVALIAPTGVYGGISVFPGANGVTIATQGVNVVLRGLTINGQGGDTGIKMTAGSKLTVDNCVISNMTGYGVFVNTPAIVRITDTTIRDTVGPALTAGIGIAVQNGAKAVITRAIVSGSSGTGLFVLGNAPNVITTADIASSTFDGNFNGVYAYTSGPNGYSKVSVRDSVAVQNLNWGFLAQNLGGAYARLFASNNNLQNNGNGIGGINLTSLTRGVEVDAVGNTISNDNLLGATLETYSLYISGGYFYSVNNAVGYGLVSTEVTPKTLK